MRRGNGRRARRLHEVDAAMRRMILTCDGCKTSQTQMKQDEEGARGRRDKPQNAVQRYTRVPGIAPKALQPFFFLVWLVANPIGYLQPCWACFKQEAPKHRNGKLFFLIMRCCASCVCAACHSFIFIPSSTDRRWPAMRARCTPSAGAGNSRLLLK